MASSWQLSFSFACGAGSITLSTGAWRLGITTQTQANSYPRLTESAVAGCFLQISPKSRQSSSKRLCLSQEGPSCTLSMTMHMTMPLTLLIGHSIGPTSSLEMFRLGREAGQTCSRRGETWCLPSSATQSSSPCDP